MAWSSIFAAAAPLVANSLLGGAPSAPYSPQIQDALYNQGQAGNNINGIGSQLAGLGGSQVGAFNNFSPQATQSVQDFLGLLKQNPYTDNFSQAQINRASGGLTGDFNAQRSNLTAQLAARGIGGSGGGAGNASSELAGGLAGLDSQQAATQAGLQNQQAFNAINQRYANLGQAAQTASGYAGQLYNQGVGALGQGAGAYGQAGNLFGNQAQGYMGLGSQQAAQNQQYNQMLQGLGSLAGGLPGMLGKSGGIGSAIPGMSSGGGNEPVSTPFGSFDYNSPGSYGFRGSAQSNPYAAGVSGTGANFFGVR